MSDKFISREIVDFGKDYLRRELPKYAGEGEVHVDVESLTYAEARSLFEEAFRLDEEINPEALGVREYFNFEAEEDVIDAIAEIRQKKDMPALIPLNQWVAFAEGTVVDTDDESRSRYETIFTTGLMRSDLRRVLKFKNQIEPKDLHFLIRNQSSSQNRSIIEITSNAIDFSQRDSRVEVTTDKNGYSVRDYGKGMTPKELIEELSIPFISGARDRSTASIGKFGMGFMTILNHLQKDGDKVVVETGRNGQGYRLEFVMQNGQMFVIPSSQDRVTQGTEISLYCEDFDEDKNISDLIEHTEFKRGATVVLNNEKIERPAGVVTIEANGAKQKESIAVSVATKEVTDTSEEDCELVIAVNGIKISGQKVKGINLPKLVAIDLPYSTIITESRDVVVYDQSTQENCRRIVQEIEDSRSLSPEQKIQLLNAITEIIYTMEQSSGIVSDSILPQISESIRTTAERAKLVCVPAVEGCDKLDLIRAVYFNPKHAELTDDFISGCDRVLTARSKDVTVHLVDFKTTDTTPTIRIGNRILVDRWLYEQVSHAPALLEGLINQYGMNKQKDVEEEISVRFETEKRRILDLTSTEKQSKYKDLSQRFDLECWDRLGLIASSEGVGGLNKLILDPDQALSEGSYDYRVFFEVYYGKLPEAIERQIAQYISGETTELNLDLSKIQDIVTQLKNGGLFEDQLQEFRQKYSYYSRDIDIAKLREQALIYAENLEAVITNPNNILSNIERYKSLRAFLQKDQIEYYEYLDPSQVQQAFCEDFLEFYKDFFGEDKIQEAQKYLIRRLRYRYDDEEDIPTTSPVTFELLVSIIKSKFDEAHDQKDQVSVSLCYSLTSIVNLMEAYTNYHEARATLTTSQQEAYDRLFQFDLGAQKGGNHSLFYAHMRLSSDNTSHRNTCFGIAEFFLRNPNAESWVYDTVLPLFEDSQFNRDDIVWLMGFLTDPYTAYEFYNNGFESHSGSRGNIFSNIKPIDESRDTLYREVSAKYSNGGMRWRDLSPDDLMAEINFAYHNAVDGFSTLGSKYFQIMEIPIVRAVIDKMDPQLRADLSRGYYRPDFELDEFEIINLYTIYQKSEGAFANLSDRKRAFLEDYIEKHFSPELITSEGYLGFLCLLKRAYYHSHLDDDLFENLMPAFTFIPDQYDRHNGFSMPSYLFSKEIINVLSSRKEVVERINVSELVKMWYKITTSRGGAVERGKEALLFGRLVDIFEDIAKKPKVLQNLLFEDLKSDKGRIKDDYRIFSDREYYHFCDPKSEIQTLSTFVQPYLIYFRSGDASELRTLFDMEIIPNGDKLSLSELILFRRMRSRDFDTAMSIPDDLANRVNNYAEGKNTFIAQRELLHAANHLPANDPYLFLRELIQNAYDVSESQTLSGEGTTPRIEIKDYRKGDAYVIEIRDSIGMTFDTIMGTLLIPNTSSKHKVGQLGRFGIGFMSVLQGSDKVEILSGNGTQQTAIVITPIFNESQQVIDYEVEFKFQESKLKGTTIRKYISGEVSSIEGAKVQSAAIKYGSYLDAKKVRVSFGDETVNTERTILSQRDIEGLGVIQILDGPEKALLQGRLFVTDLPDYIEEMIPEDIRELATKNGLTINLDKVVELIRSRADIAKKEYYIPILRSVIPEMIIESTLRRFADNKLDLKMIPYDYFWDDGYAKEAFGRESDEQVSRDADMINRGLGIKDFSPYMNKNNLLQLITAVEFYEYKGKKRSLREFAKLIEEGEDFENVDVPERIKSLAKRSKERRETIKTEIKRFHEDGEIEVQPFTLNQRGEETLRRKSDTHYALLHILREINTYRGIRGIGFYNVPNASTATAFLNTEMVFWNLLSISYRVENLQRAIQDKESISDEELAEAILPFVATGTHEDAHLSQRTDHWTMHHNDEFFKQQKRLWGELLYRQPNILSRIRGFIANLQGTMLSRADLLKELGFN